MDVPIRKFAKESYVTTQFLFLQVALYLEPGAVPQDMERSPHCPLDSILHPRWSFSNSGTSPVTSQQDPTRQSFPTLLAFPLGFRWTPVWKWVWFLPTRASEKVKWRVNSTSWTAMVMSLSLIPRYDPMWWFRREQCVRLHSARDQTCRNKAVRL